MNRKQFATLCLAIIVALGLTVCATVKPTPPVGCEESLIWKYSPWSNVILAGAITGCYTISQNNPVYYAAIKLSAQEAVVLLQGTGTTYQKLSEVPNIGALLTSQLATIFPPGQTINVCDRDILLGYLKML